MPRSLARTTFGSGTLLGAAKRLLFQLSAALGIDPLGGSSQAAHQSDSAEGEPRPWRSTTRRPVQAAANFDQRALVDHEGKAIRCASRSFPANQESRTRDGFLSRAPSSIAATLPLHEAHLSRGLKGAMRELSDKQQLKVCILFRTPDRFPFLPKLERRLPRGVPANIATVKGRAAMILATASRRLRFLSPLLHSVESAGGVLHEYYPVGNICLASLSLRNLTKLRMLPEVAAVALAEEKLELLAKKCPQNAPCSCNVTWTGRLCIGADAYSANGYTGEGFHVGIIDSGIQPKHKLLSAPGQIGLAMDCVNGDIDCNAASAFIYDPVDKYLVHGTPIAAIVSGNASISKYWAGITEATIDSYCVTTFGKCNADPGKTSPESG